MMKSDLRALIIDDGRGERETVSAALKAEGIAVEEAEDGAHAWEILSGDSPPPIVLVDWVIPGEIDGLELCRRLRHSPQSSEHYVILATVKQEQEDLLEGLSAGADEFIAKPFAPEDLLAKVQIGFRSLQKSGVISRKTLAAVAEARAGGQGEVVVRSPGIVGRIFFRDGDIFWAHLSSDPGSLSKIVEGTVELDREEEAAVLAESHKAGRAPTEILVEWGIVDRVRLRARLLTWLKGKLKVILSLPNAEALYLPTRAGVGPSTLGFPLAELLPEAEDMLQEIEREGPWKDPTPGGRAPEARPTERVALGPAARDRELDQLCRHLLAEVPGSRGSILFDLEMRSIVGAHGDREATEALEAQLSNLYHLFSPSEESFAPFESAVLLGSEVQTFVGRSGSRVIMVQTGMDTRIGLALVILKGFSF